MCRFRVGQVVNPQPCTGTSCVQETKDQQEGTGVVMLVAVVCTDIDAPERDSQEEHRGDGARLVDRSPSRHVVTRSTENESLIWRIVFRHPMLAIISMCVIAETNDGKIPMVAGVHVYPICKLPETSHVGRWGKKASIPRCSLPSRPTCWTT